MGGYKRPQQGQLSSLSGGLKSFHIWALGLSLGWRQSLRGLEKMQGLLSSGLGMSTCHFCHVSPANSDSRSEKTGPPLHERSCSVTLQGAWLQGGVVNLTTSVIICLCPRRLTSMEADLSASLPQSPRPAQSWKHHSFRLQCE